MTLCLQKLTEKIQAEAQTARFQQVPDFDAKRPPPDLWTILLRSFSVEHPGITCKLDSDLTKLVKQSKPKILRKEDIGAPQDFKHLQHGRPFKRFFSLRPSLFGNQLGVGESDPDICEFFKKAGVTEKHLRRPGVRKLIKEFVEKNGGIGSIKQEIKNGEKTRDILKEKDTQGYDNKGKPSEDSINLNVEKEAKL